MSTGFRPPPNPSAVAILATLQAKDEASPTLRGALRTVSEVGRQAVDTAAQLEVYTRAERGLIDTLADRDAAMKRSVAETAAMHAGLTRIQQVMIGLQERQTEFGLGVREMGSALGQAGQQMKAEEANLRSVIEVVEQASRAYQQLTDKRASLVRAQGVVQEQQDQRAAFPYFGRGEESRQLADAMNFIKAAIQDVDEALAGLPPSISLVNSAMRTGAERAREEGVAIRSVTEIVNEAIAAYQRLSERREQLTNTQGVLQSQIATREASPDFNPQDVNGLRAALNLVNSALTETEKSLAVLPPGVAELSAAMRDGAQAAKEEAASLLTITELVNRASSAYQRLTDRRDLLTRSKGIVEEQIATQKALPGGGDVTALQNALNLMNAELEEAEAALGVLPKGMKEFMEATRAAAAAAKEEAAALSQANAQKKSAMAQTSELVSRYQTLTKQLDIQRHVMDDLSRSTLPGAAQASQLSASTLQEVEAALSKLTPQERLYAQAVMHATEVVNAQAGAQRRAGHDFDESLGKFAQGAKIAEDIGRGLASSLFSFSLLAGGWVAAGHLIGNVFSGAGEAAGKLQKALADISSLNPQLDTSTLVGQITDMEVRLGALSENIIEVYKIAAQAAKGDLGGTEQLTEELTTGAQGGRQDAAAWAQAATQTLAAYGLELEEVTRVQDVLTVAVQNSAAQGDSLIKVWGSVSKAAAGTGTSLEDNAAAVALLAQKGGDLEENLRALKGLYDALSTEQVRRQLSELGIATADADGNLLSFIDILGQLNDRIANLPGADRESVIAKMFNDRDVRNVMRTLLTNFSELTAGQQKFLDASGASAKARMDWLETAAARTQRLDAAQQALNESVGDFLNLEKHVMDLATSQRSNSEWGINTVMQNIADFLAYGFDAPKIKAIERSVGYFDSVATSIKRIGDVASAATPDMARFLGTVLDRSQTGGSPLEGISSDITDLLASARQTLDRDDSWGTYTSKAEKELADLAAAVQQHQRALTYWEMMVSQSTGSAAERYKSFADEERAALQQAVNDAQQAASNISASFSSIIAAAAGASAGTVLFTKSMADFYNEGMRAGRSTDPTESGAEWATQDAEKKKAAADTLASFIRQQQATAILDAAQENLNATTKRYADQVDALRDKQQALQRALHDNSTPDLAAAYSDLAVKTSTLEAGTKRFDDALHDLQLQLRDLEKQSETALDPLKRQLDEAEASLASWEEGAGAVTTILGDQLYDLEQKAAATRRETEYMLRPLQEEAEKASDALQTLEDEFEDLQKLYDAQEQEIRDDIDRLEELRDTNLQPLQDEIDGLNRALEDLGIAEEAALRPLRDLAYEQGQALQAIRDEIEAISEEYENKLLPLQEEYNELQREEERIAREKEHHDRALSIENLTAQLGQATPGSSAALQLNRQIAELRNEQARSDRMGELKDQIQAIEDERDARLRAAREREEQAQDELDETNRQIELIERRYELERRQLEDTLRLRERAFRDQKEQYNEAIENRKTELTAMEKEHAQTLKQKEADVDLAKTRAENAQKTVDDLATTRDAIQKVDDAAVEAKRAELEATQHTQDQQRRIRSESVKEAKAAYDEEKIYWDGLIGKVNEKIERTTFDGQEFERVAKQQVKDAQTHFQTLRDEYQKNIDQIGYQIAATQQTATDAVEAAKVIVEQEREKQKALSLTYAWINAINQAMKSGVPIDVGQLPPDVRAWYERMYGTQPPDTGLAPPYEPPPRQQQHAPGTGPNAGGDDRPAPTAPTVPVAPRPAPPAMPVTDTTAQARAGVGGVQAGVTVNVSVDTGADTQDLTNPRFWERVGTQAFEGIQRGLAARRGVTIATE